MKVSVMGTGYVGLVSGVCLAEKGHEVVCVDVDEAKVDKINNGISPIYEVGLEDLLKHNVGSGLNATSDLHSSVINSDLSLVAVGTPFDGERIDLTYIKTVSHQIGEALREKDGYHVVVVKSTVVPRTTDDVVLPILEEASGKKAGIDFGVGMNPEFLREGEAVDDFMHPDRIVLGGIDDRTHAVLGELYAPFKGVDILETNNCTAEMIKYTSNSLLATMISFSNEIGNLCASIGNIDALDVVKGVHLDKRFSPILDDGTRIVPGFTAYIEAGCGFGGSCFPKDVKALIAHGRRVGEDMQLMDAVIDVNRKQPQQMLDRLNKHFSSVKDVTIAVLGLAFKPGTDDMRESPAIPVVKWLQQQGAKIKAYDPVARQEAKDIFGHSGIEYCDEVASAIEGAEVIMLITRWVDFKAIPGLLQDLDKQPLLIDGRRMIDKNSVARYEGIGL
jgi:UDPglucose 6-dehydrogenase/GDP-mannose 6-dehydrogenase